jgi:peptidoglycan/xylan/chitin deacetylase (PgdA/CDA1 family)
LEEQIEVSAIGTAIILDILDKHKIPATFFSTVIFAQNARDQIARVVGDGHELASHGYYHSQFIPQHLADSRKILEEISGKPVTGFRMARMMPVDDHEIQQAGYQYNSSLNPIYLPGRYNNFFKPRTLFRTKELIQLPASVTPLIRVPLFWLSFHNFPLQLYKAACLRTINNDGYLNIYFHPWEFTDLTNPRYGLPAFVSRNSGEKMIRRFDAWIKWMKKQKYNFSTIESFLKTV